MKHIKLFFGCKNIKYYNFNYSSLTFEIKAKQFYAASQRVP